MFAALLSLALSMASLLLAVAVVQGALRARRASRASAAGIPVAVVVPLLAGGDPGRSLARCLSAATHRGPRVLRPVSLAGDGLAERWAEEARRADPDADVASLGVESSPRHVPPAWLAAAALEAAPGDIVVLADPRACPAAREATRLWDFAGPGGVAWAAALPVPAPGAGAASAVLGGVLQDLAPLLSAACGAAGLPSLLGAGHRPGVESAAADALALHRPSLADAVARGAGADAALVAVPAAVAPGHEGDVAAAWLRPLWRTRPAGAAWAVASLLAAPASLATALLAGGTARAVAVTALVLALAARLAAAGTFVREARGGAVAARTLLLAPLGDLAAAAVLLAQAPRTRVRIAGTDWQVRRGGVLAPPVPRR